MGINYFLRRIYFRFKYNKQILDQRYLPKLNVKHNCVSGKQYLHPKLQYFKLFVQSTLGYFAF